MWLASRRGRKRNQHQERWSNRQSDPAASQTEQHLENRSQFVQQDKSRLSVSSHTYRSCVSVRTLARFAKKLISGTTTTKGTQNPQANVWTKLLVQMITHSFINGSTARCWALALLQFRNHFYTEGTLDEWMQMVTANKSQHIIKLYRRNKSNCCGCFWNCMKERRYGCWANEFY
jgi:hypothetical protein